jgi:AcrR family transcriptional regulator
VSNVRNKILEAAQRCFRERGVRQTSVLDIVAAAGIGRSTFYRQFRDLDDILVTLAAEAFISRLPAYSAPLTRADLAAGDRWRNFLVAMVESGQVSDADNPFRAEDISLRVSRLYYTAYPDKHQLVIGAMVPLIEAGIRANELRTDVASTRIAEWILRQTWALSSIPMALRWERNELNDYIETFVLPSFLRRDTAVGGAGTVQRLSDEIDRLARVVARLETQGSTAE